MSSSRHEVQEFIEFKLGCANLLNWTNHKHDLLSFQIDDESRDRLNNCIKSDTYSYFHKAVLSFVQALINIQNSNYNWSIVKLYYCCFYLIRADILLSNYCIVRCGGLYLIKNEVGSTFTPFTQGKIRGDHQMTVALLKKLKNDYSIIDELLDNDLEGSDVYTWLMKHRERSNYQLKDFSDPQIDPLFNHLDNYFKTNNLFDLLSFYKNSNYNISFDLDHAVLSIPFKKILQIKSKIVSKHGTFLCSRQYFNKFFYIRAELSKVSITGRQVKDLLT